MKRIWWNAFLLLALAGAVWGQSPDPVPVSEMPVRGGNIVVKVPGFDAARRQVINAAGTQGAELLAARTLVDGKGRKHGWLQFRLPASRLPALLGAVQGFGKLYGENVATTDHASEYEELARRIVRLQQHETRLTGILQSGRRLRGGDLLYVQERLFRASVDESLLAQRRADLEREARVNIVQIEMFEPGALPPTLSPATPNLAHGFLQAANLARAHLNRLLARGATAGAYALVYAPLWLPVLLAGLLLLRALWLRRRSIALRLRAAALQTAAFIRRVREARGQEWHRNP